MTKKQYVEFYFPGNSVAGQNEREVDSRKVDISGLIPNGAISYRFFSRNFIDEKVDYSPMHFLGKEYSTQEFKQKYPQLQDEPELSKAERVVKAISGGFYPLKENDLVVTVPI